MNKISCLLMISKKTKISFEQDEYSKFLIQLAHKRGDLLDAVKFILQFNETVQSYLT